MTHAVRLLDVHKRYGRREVLAGVSLDLAPGTRLGLIGPAASGKTVLCKLVCGLEQPDRGSVEVLGESLAGKREAELGAVRRRIGMLFQSPALFAGSYFSIWLDDAQLELGKILRDDLHDLPGAAAAFRQLPEDYPASILRDDALYELAVTLEQLHDHAGACAAIARLAREFADSKYLARGRELCP